MARAVRYDAQVNISPPQRQKILINNETRIHGDVATLRRVKFEHWSFGAFEIIGPLDHWTIRVLEHWNTAVLEHWDVTLAIQN